MAYQVLLHPANEDPLLADMDELPDPTSGYVHVYNMRRRDGKLPAYIDDRATSFIWPWHRLTLVEIFGTTEGSKEDEEDLAGGGDLDIDLFRD